MSRDCVLFEIAARVLCAVAHVCVCGEMEYEVGATHRRLQRRRLQEISFRQVESRMARCGLEKAPLAGGEVIEAHDVPAAGQQPVGQMTADESRAPGDEGLHGSQRLDITIRK